MKIRLTPMQMFRLAEDFASSIRHRVTTRLLARVGTLEDAPDSEFAEVQDAIRSLPAGSSERREFIATVRFHFLRQRELRDMPPRWQDYVARVNAHRAQAAA